MVPVPISPAVSSELAWLELPDLEAELLRLMRQVPRGAVCTYGDLARALGDVSASRWVGSVLREHRHTSRCGCHRVVGYDGSVRATNQRLESEQKARLQAEGVGIRLGRVAMFRHWNQFDSPAPLRKLADWQASQAARISNTAALPFVRRVGGVDVAYRGDGSAVAAYVLLEAASRQVLWQTTARVAATFPYISGYLTFREVPPMLVALAQARAQGWLPDVLLVDGAGVLHPRRCGLACWVGLAADLPSIGITKSWLAGRRAAPGTPQYGLPADAQPLLHAGQFSGAAVLPRSGSQRPLYVSPGNGIDPLRAVEIVDAMLGTRRLPDPIYWADRYSRG